MLTQKEDYDNVDVVKLFWKYYVGGCDADFQCSQSVCRTFVHCMFINM